MTILPLIRTCIAYQFFGILRFRMDRRHYILRWNERVKAGAGGIWIVLHNEKQETSENESLSPDQPSGIPVLRIYTCGLFTVEILQEVPDGDAAQARYQVLDLSGLRGRGSVPSLSALKLFVHQP